MTEACQTRPPRLKASAKVLSVVHAGPLSATMQKVVFIVNREDEDLTAVRRLTLMPGPSRIYLWTTSRQLRHNLRHIPISDGWVRLSTGHPTPSSAYLPAQRRVL